MKICVLQPDFSDSDVDIGNYHPPRDLSHLWPEAHIENLFLKKRTTYAQLKAAARNNYDIFVNLCEGYLEWDVPSIDVIHALDMLNLPYTGPTAELYDPPKDVMKYVAYTCGVLTPAHRLITDADHIDGALNRLRFPMFVKPGKAGDSLGIDENSCVATHEALKARASAVINEYGDALIEEYIDGREFTVLVAAEAENPNRCRSFVPVEYKFGAVPFKTYAMKTSELHPGRNVPCDDNTMAMRLRESAEKIFTMFSGKGYGRMDFRVDSEGRIYFLEVNFTCSIFYVNGDDGSADFILDYDKIGRAGFLRHIVAEGIARHKRKQRLYEVRGDALSGFGIYARRPIGKGTLIYNGESKNHRIVTRRYATENPSLLDPNLIGRYAYPLSDEVFITWDEQPSRWDPQNHACEPNCAFNGLDVEAIRDIGAGEELTLDYSAFVNEHADTFKCHCGSLKCREVIRGAPGNTITSRETALRTTE